MFEIDPLAADKQIKKKAEENAKARIVNINF